jgi:hypothetical protein
MGCLAKPLEEPARQRAISLRLESVVVPVRDPAALIQLHLAAPAEVDTTRGAPQDSMARQVTDMAVSVGHGDARTIDVVRCGKDMTFA